LKRSAPASPEGHAGYAIAPQPNQRLQCVMERETKTAASCYLCSVL